MKKVDLPYCFLFFEKHFAILEMKNDGAITVETAMEITNLLKEHYNGEQFILIANRTSHHAIDLNVYRGKILKNMIGFAIVSSDPLEKERATAEQSLWQGSFTFFTKLEDATSWAESFFS
ncbi:thymidylate synthase [Aquimarina brevivitae]|uniref:SpoIIAA-like protein n=1 Tax=Aquimarina brevivitae TaxID=323412 RepID=A0A4Q7PGS9_9FLAO|nr:thymidylate synthase [Aquimarina brevivitae]RZS99743.1 hypothetical protein EV197_0969 [Aquimarina brevivitae]